MSIISNQFIEGSKRFNMKELKKLDFYRLVRFLEKLDEIDCDEIIQLTDILENKLLTINIGNRKERNDYKRTFKQFIKVTKKRYPQIEKAITGSRGVMVASSATMGAGNVSAGTMGAGVAVAASLKFDDGTSKKE